MMKEERMRVLKMVEEGKISVAEATELLEALSLSKGNTDASKDFQEKVTRLSANAESLARDLGGKMEEAFRDMEPKIKKATKVVVEKTAAIVEEISRNLNESLKNLEKVTSECGEECCCEEECGCCEEQECAPSDEPCECCEDDNENLPN